MPLTMPHVLMPLPVFMCSYSREIISYPFGLLLLVIKTYDSNQMDTRADISRYLRDLADGIDNDTLSPEITSKISEFFTQMLFAKSLTEDKEQEDMMKFLSLGWYIYTHLKDELPKKNGEEDAEDDEDEPKEV